MVIAESGLCAVMKDAFRKKSTGYKVAADLPEEDEEELILSGPGWTAFINREHIPRKVLALIVEHMGDIPRVGQAYHVKEKNTQAEILNIAIPNECEPVKGALVRRTNLTYNGYQIWQRTDNQTVFMLDTKMEALMDNYNRDVVLTQDGQFYLEGVASRLYVRPQQVKQNESTALHHLAKLQWV